MSPGEVTGRTPSLEEPGFRFGLPPRGSAAAAKAAAAVEVAKQEAAAASENEGKGGGSRRRRQPSHTLEPGDTARVEMPDIPDPGSSRASWLGLRVVVLGFLAYSLWRFNMGSDDERSLRAAYRMIDTQ